MNGRVPAVFSAPDMTAVGRTGRSRQCTKPIAEKRRSALNMKQRFDQLVENNDDSRADEGVRALCQDTVVHDRGGQVPQRRVCMARPVELGDRAIHGERQLRSVGGQR